MIDNKVGLKIKHLLPDKLHVYTYMYTVFSVTILALTKEENDCYNKKADPQKLQQKTHMNTYVYKYIHVHIHIHVHVFYLYMYTYAIILANFCCQKFADSPKIITIKHTKYFQPT